MNLLIIGDFSEAVKNRIRDSFPDYWTVNISDMKNAVNYLGNADALIPEHVIIDSYVISEAPNLKMIQTGAGFDNIDLTACSERHITVCNASGINANAVAEHTMALILSRFKNIVELDSDIKNGKDFSDIVYIGGELRGKTAGIIGLGNIGLRTAELCNAFGMNVIGYNRRPKEIDYIRNCTLTELLKSSDVVSLHIPLTKETFHLIGRNELSLMKKEAFIVNTSRGAVIDECALIEALEEKVISGACLDVFENEPLPSDSKLRSMSNVILTPHTAGYPDASNYHKSRYDFFAENILNYFSGKNIKNKVI